ncbi:PREDICTED: selenoprotein M-like, partial [Wasmannia auropunctata]|uniref:selenoprotein M-like n=1 Tax=Wasmannia auropunctata TaxID=64793 RepID=UPI0005ED4B14
HIYSDNVEFKHIPGAIPELVLFNVHDEEVERIILSKLTREECNELLVSKGFTKKSKDNKDEM